MELTQSLQQFVVSVLQILPPQEQHQTEPVLENQMQMVEPEPQTPMGQEPVHQMELLAPQIIHH
jgi:hypothetical protein